VVEKFLPERRGDFYCLRTWVFFGRSERAALHLSRDPVVKRVTTEQREIVDHVPDEIRAMRRRLGFDYGKFDFVIHEGVPVLLDANCTPTTHPEWNPRVRALAENLARGLYDLLEWPPPRSDTK
jgi:hypothetical protein